MTDSPDPAESPEIEEVRRLLADARHTEPMPDDVVARMDDVIAGLRDTPAEHPAAAVEADNVVPLAVHRRRRAAGMLVAAAAIVVGGVVVAENLPQSSSPSAESAGASAAQDNNQNDQNGSTVPQKSPKPHLFGNENSARGGLDAVLNAGRLVVHPRRFSLDALAGRQLLHRATPDSAISPGLARCASIPAGDGTVLRATYRQAPAALVYRRASGGSQVVDLYVCGSRRPIRSATLPAP